MCASGLGGHQRRAQVLVVDDNDAIVEMVREALVSEGYEVNAARDGAAALELLTRSDPALVLVDVRMPIMDGWSFIEKYRQAGGQARVFVFSAASGEIEARCRSEVDGVLAKPFELDALLEAAALATNSAGDGSGATRG